MARSNSLNSNLQFCSNLPASGLNIGVNSAIIYSDASGVTQASAPLTNGQILIGSTGASPTVSTLTAGSGIAITNGAGSITVSAVSSDPVWSVVTADTAAVVNGAYITNSATIVTLTLPTTAAVGTSISVAGMGAGGWKIAQNAGQSVRMGDLVTTTGTGGYLQSYGQYDSMQLICIVANTQWTCFCGPLSAGIDVV